MRFNLILTLLLLINLSAVAKDLYLNSLKLYNLPDIYKDIFEKFFIENLNISSKKGYADIDVEIKWLSFNYSICFFVHRERIYFLENICFTSSSAEDIVDDLTENLKNSKFIKLEKNIIKKTYSLKIINPKGVVEKKANIISTKGDKLTSFKDVYSYKGQKGEFITIGGASATHDIIVIPENSSAFLLQKFLNGYKIDKVYLLK